MRKLIKPVAIIGLPIQRYHAAHCCSPHDRAEKSVPAYSSLAVACATAFGIVTLRKEAMAGGGWGWGISTDVHGYYIVDFLEWGESI